MNKLSDDGCEDPVAAKLDVLCLGLIVVDHIAAPIDHLPAAGELILTTDCMLSLGGCASNVAVDLTKMGVAAAVCGCVGNDPFGDYAESRLKQLGVPTPALVRHPTAPTSQTLIVNVRGQDRRFIHLKGANDRFALEHVPLDLLSAVQVVYVGGLYLMDAFTPVVTADLFRQARAAGVKTVLDVVTPGPSPRYLDGLKTVLPWTDVFLPNADEGRLMSGLTDPAAQAAMFHDLGAGCAVVTDGGHGAFLVSANHRLHAKAFAVDFVDGTGSGDAFDAGFIFSLLQGLDPADCLKYGSALGAACVRKSGATDGVFTRAECDAFLADHPFHVADMAATTGN